MGTPHRLETIDIHSDRLKAAVLAAGPAAPVQNCPKWTVHDLVTHLARVLSSSVAVITDRAADQSPPTGWTDLLGYWDGQRLAAREALRRPAESPVRSRFPRGGDTLTIGELTRRLAHEMAIHRLDAESALPEPPPTRYAAAFAADGVDEFLTFLMPRRSSPSNRDGIARVETEGRSWTIALREGEPPALTGESSPDVTLSGPADDVYRALWGRPHHAVITGDGCLLEPLAAP
jgi:uncharacterized protein (TIGR03083 family)